MTDTLQHQISKIGLPAASAALTLAVVLVLGVVTSQSAQAQTFTDLYNFAGGPDGANPFGVIMDAKGNLYGDTVEGGDLSCGVGGGDGCGVVFKLSKSGKETVLHSFARAYPSGGLIMDAEGNFYGATYVGGNPNCGGGCGTVFKVSKTGKETVLYKFKGGADGANPVGSLIMDAMGTLYGTTNNAGASNCQPPIGCGTVFKLSKTGKETVLHAFTGSDGANPFGDLIMDAMGNLYGTTFEGGNLTCGFEDTGCGTVFKVSKSGKETVLHAFDGSDGMVPNAGLIMDAKGNLYGTTGGGGSHRYGTVFRVSKSGKETVLHSFAGGSSDGAIPRGVIMDTESNLFGVTMAGGERHLCVSTFYTGCGTVYELNKKGTLTLLHRFHGSDGEAPGYLIMDAKGNLYGTTGGGGSHGYGTVWKLEP